MRDELYENQTDICTMWVSAHFNLVLAIYKVTAENIQNDV